MIRKAQTEDLEAIMALYDDYMQLHSTLDSVLIDYKKEDKGFYHYLISILENESYLLLVSESDGHINGFSLARISPLPAIYKATQKLTVQDIAVSRSYQNEGIGGSLITETLKWAQTKGVTLAETTAHAANQQALQFWQKMGFAVGNLQLYKNLQAPTTTNHK